MTKLKVIEVEVRKLTPGAKYIITLSPDYMDYFTEVDNELRRLIGEDTYTLFPFSRDVIRVLEVLPKVGDASNKTATHKTSVNK